MVQDDFHVWFFFFFLSTFPNILFCFILSMMAMGTKLLRTLFLFVLDSVDVITINMSSMNYASNMAGV